MLKDASIAAKEWGKITEIKKEDELNILDDLVEVKDCLEESCTGAKMSND